MNESAKVLEKHLFNVGFHRIYDARGNFIWTIPEKI